MLTWRFAIKLNRSQVELVDLVIEKTKSYPCVIVKETEICRQRPCYETSISHYKGNSRRVIKSIIHREKNSN